MIKLLKMLKYKYFRYYHFFVQIRVKVSIFQIYCKGVELISNLKKIKRVGFILIVIFLMSIFLNSIQFPESQGEEISTLHTQSENYYTTQILEDPSFDSPIGCWNCSVEGDETDVNATINQGVANFNVMGAQNTFSFIADPPLASDWNHTLNPEFPSFPDWYWFDSNGACVSHYWNEGPDQSVAINWNKNLTMPVDVSDYIITSAQISAIVNGSVETFSADPPDYSDGIETANDICDEYSSGDYTRFYVKISDLERSKNYEIAHYQTFELGQDSSPEIPDLSDTELISISEEDLIIFLTSVLNSDNRNFTLTIGMRIWCEDNFPQDSDWWQILTIKSINLTFIYEKKIDKFTSLSWSQIGNKIEDLSDYQIDIIGAKLNFKYKIDKFWPSSLSSNSDIRIMVNNIKILDPDKLIDTNITGLYQEAKLGGYDIISLISKEENVSIKIQLYLGDEFIFNEIINISIDDVFLEISYIEFIPEGDISVLLLWLFITVLFVIIGILGVLSVRSYVILPRQQRKKSYLVLRTQKFKDIRNLQAIIAMHKPSGLPLYSHSYSSIMKGKKTLFSGFIQAVSIIGEEMTRTNKKEEKMKKSKDKIDFHKVVELDLKQFYCLVLDVEELRMVLILKSKSSKRLKEILVHFSFALYLKISDRLKNSNNDLSSMDEILRPLIYEYFDIYYKDPFKVNIQESEILKYKKKLNLSKFEFQIMNTVFSILKEKSHFKLMDILERETDKNEDEIINALESLIEFKLIKPIK